MGRLFSSLALFWSFLLLGFFVSALGPAVPSLSRDVGVSEVAFGRAFSLRGLGYLLGSYSSSVTLTSEAQETWLQCLLNNRMYRLGAATAGMGLFAIAIDTTATFAWVCIWCFCQGFCGGAIDAIANAAISAVHGAGGAPWMQGLHFCFSAGALIAPAIVGQLGYRAVFLYCGFSALPAGLTCCVAGNSVVVGSDDISKDVAHGQKHSYIEAQKQDDSTADLVPEGIELVEGVRQPGQGVHSGLTREARVEEKEKIDRLSPATTEEELLQGIDEGIGGLASVDKNPMVNDRDQLVAALSRDVRKIGTFTKGAVSMPPANPPTPSAGIYEDDTERIGIEDRYTSIVVTEDEQQLREEVTALRRKNEDGDASGGTGGAREGKTSPPTLVALLVLFLFLYVGVEVAFGAWVAVVILRDRLADEAVAALMASLFWGGITAGRLLAVPLAVRYSTDSLVRANLLGCLFSSALLLALGRDSLGWAAIGAGLFGVCMASIFPLAMSLLPSWGYELSDKSSSRMVIGGALGEMILPAFIAWFLGPNDGGWPTALYAVCAAVSVLMVGVYGLWCRLAGGPPANAR